MKTSSGPPSSAAKIAANVTTHFDIPREAIRAQHLTGFIGNLNRVFADVSTVSVAAVFSDLTLEIELVSELLWGVIVETRQHAALEAVVLNISESCGIPVQLFHSQGNLQFILASRIADLIKDGRVVLTAMDTPPNISAAFYNQLLLSLRFWQQMKGRDKILVFQTDSLCCPAADYSATDFLSYDYVGSRWARNRPVGLVIDGGSGGFSLRNWTQSVTCLERFPPTLWPGGEDGYFAFYLDLMGAKVASLEVAGKFSTQDSFLHRSFGCHQIGRLNNEDLNAFISYCPQASAVFPELTHRIHRQAITSRKPMFISHKHQLIYFEVPRTGSNSVTQTLNGLDPESPTVVGRELHGSYRDYHHFTEEAGKHPEYRLIAGHRNPYDRLWSFWKHRKQTGNPSAFRTISWARYIDWVCEPASSKEVAGALLDVPIAEMLDIAKVGFWLDFHRMEASWAQLCDELDVPLVALARVNVSPDHGEMQSAYTKGMAERVAKRFAEDFAYFGYGLDSWRSGEALEGRVL